MAKIVHMEHEGVVYRGFAMGHPQEYWDGDAMSWKPHAGAGEQKPQEWGSRITEAEANTLMRGVRMTERAA
jgi:hypothetical protein